MDQFKGLSRNVLVTGALQAALRAQAGPDLTWTDAAITASLSATLAAAPGEDIWVFAYGSLLWNPIFPVAARRRAHIHGYHRSFCLRAHLGRGTPARPGLVLGLDTGGSCTSLVLKIGGTNVADELRLLWQREMIGGFYVPRWIRARSAESEITVLAFVADRQSPHYAGRLTDVEAATVIAGASGLVGSNFDYLHRTERALFDIGIADRRLMALRQHCEDRRLEQGLPAEQPMAA
ncbi:MAG TPA: gamma-glutamylcyclotransferase [Devosiaceae bacterium]